MTNIRRTLTMLALASALTLTGCNSGQESSPATQPGAAGAQASEPTQEPLTANQVNVEVKMQAAPTLSADGQWIEVATNLTNNGKTILTSNGTYPVHLGAHSVDASGKIVDMDLSRADIPALAPGSQAVVTIRLPVNQVLGRSAQILPVQEGVSWFDSWGTTPLVVGPFSRCESATAGKICDAGEKPLAAARN